MSTGGALATITVLQRQFPDWAMWRDGDGQWSATRAPGDREPPQGSWLLWVRGETAEELVARMREEDDR